MEQEDETAPDTGWNPSRFDADPEAIAWARAKILKVIHRAEAFEQDARKRGNMKSIEQWRLTAAFLRRTLTASQGCVVTAFDDRLPGMVEAMQAAEQRRSGKKNGS